MTIVKKIKLVLILSITFISCKSDDDLINILQAAQPSNFELLTTGIWYQDDISPGSFSDCEKNTSIEFFVNGVVVIDSFDDSSGTCESEGIENGNYALTDNVNMTITQGSEMIVVVINSITTAELTVSTTDGETLIFDKIQG